MGFASSTPTKHKQKGHEGDQEEMCCSYRYDINEEPPASRLENGDIRHSVHRRRGVELKEVAIV